MKHLCNFVSQTHFQSIVSNTATPEIVFKQLYMVQYVHTCVCRRFEYLKKKKTYMYAVYFKT